MKKCIVLVFLFVVSVFLFHACSRKTKTMILEEEPQKVVHIGVSKIIAHPALDAIEKGLVEVITDSGIEVEFDFQNANGDNTAANSIAQLFRDQKVDIAVSIATPTTQTLVQQLTGIPIFYSGITDPEGAGILSKINDGMQIAGYSDLSPVSDHITLIKRIQPEVKVIGQIFSADEDNSRFLNQMSTKATKDNGIELISAAITSTTEVKDAALSIIDRVEALYITTDNKVISAMTAVSEVADQYDIPLYSAAPISMEGNNKIVVAMGIDYDNMGKLTGELIVRYLKGDNSVFDNPIVYPPLKDQIILINQEQVGKLGLNIPEDIREIAREN